MNAEQENELRDSRHLATLQVIGAILPHPNADKLEIAEVLGWRVCVKKGEYQAGDLTIYCEVDSVFPDVPEFEFLANKQFRIKTVRLRGEVSQGICIHPQALIDGPTYDCNYAKGMDKVNEQGMAFWSDGHHVKHETVGDDVTDLLAIKKYIAPISAQLSGTARGNFPQFVHKTDQERIQNIYHKLVGTPEFEDGLWEASVKMDGSSCTIYNNFNHTTDVNDFGVCSRNLDLRDVGENTFWKMSHKYDLENKLTGFCIAIQSEMYGPGIQGNNEQTSEIDIAVFDVFDITSQTYLSSHDRGIVCRDLKIPQVPIIERLMINDFSLANLLDYADEPSLFGKSREGVVFKSIMNPRISFKVISNRWLLGE